MEDMCVNSACLYRSRSFLYGRLTLGLATEVLGASGVLADNLISVGH